MSSEEVNERNIKTLHQALITMTGRMENLEKEVMHMRSELQHAARQNVEMQERYTQLVLLNRGSGATG